MTNLSMRSGEHVLWDAYLARSAKRGELRLMANRLRPVHEDLAQVGRSYGIAIGQAVVAMSGFARAYTEQMQRAAEQLHAANWTANRTTRPKTPNPHSGAGG